jgi:hypothetical protein
MMVLYPITRQHLAVEMQLLHIVNIFSEEDILGFAVNVDLVPMN